MKLPPASKKASRICRLSSLDEPQPQSSPKVMVPRHNCETRRPDLPRSRYRMFAPLEVIHSLDSDDTKIALGSTNHLNHGKHRLTQKWGSGSRPSRCDPRATVAPKVFLPEWTYHCSTPSHTRPDPRLSQSPKLHPA